MACANPLDDIEITSHSGFPEIPIFVTAHALCDVQSRSGPEPTVGVGSSFIPSVIELLDSDDQQLLDSDGEVLADWA